MLYPNNELSFEVHLFKHPLDIKQKKTFFPIPYFVDAPLCRPGQIQVYNIARHETAKIVCELESNPSHDVNFTWKFNTSIADITDLPASLIAIERSKSVAHYTPTNEQV